MTKYILRVDDVGRIPGDSPEVGTDGDLSYFARWREVSGLIHSPVSYGVTLSWIKPEGLHWLRDNIRYPEGIAVHGYHHTRHKPVTQYMMSLAMDALTFHTAPYAYIPPFNYYSDDTLHDWQLVGGKYFFGGFIMEHHKYLDIPVRPSCAPHIIHIPATRHLYAHAKPLLEAIQESSSPRASSLIPSVITLHVPWDNNLSEVQVLVDEVKNHLVPVDILDTIDIGIFSHHGH